MGCMDFATWEPMILMLQQNPKDSYSHIVLTYLKVSLILAKLSVFRFF